MKARKFLTIIVGVLFLLTMVPLTGHADVPESINYQGLLTGSDGNPVPDGDYLMSFAIYDAPTGGTSLWTESQTVTVTNGIYNVILGQPGNLLDPDDFDGDLYLGVTVGADAEMTPRQKLISTPFAMKAAKADDADTLDDMDSLDFAFSSHDHPWEEISDRPSGLDDGDDVGITSETDPTVLASVKDGVNWGELSGVPAGFADGVDNEGLTTETDPTVLVSVKDGVSWTEVTNKPSGFADGVDNEGVTTSSDYGRSGVAANLYEGSSTLTSKYVNESGDDMTGNLDVVAYSSGKAAVRGADQFFTTLFAEGQLGVLSPTGLPYNPINIGVLGIKTDNGGSGIGVYGWTYDDLSSNYAMYAVADGDTTSGTNYGIYAKAENGYMNYGGYFEAKGTYGRGVWAKHENGTYGMLASGSVGVTGFHSIGCYGWLGTANYGVYGVNSSTNGYGVYASAYGTNGTGIYAKGGSSGWAGDFRGNVRIRNHSTGATVMELGAGLDYAEGFDVSDLSTIEPGSVLIIDPDNPGKLALSKMPYDTKVAGIAAGANGLGSGVRLGGEEFDQDVALAGRVYCNVDATEVGVEPGDMLTTSSTQGYAQKATDYMRAQGAILGKAMQRLEKGQKGQILVLVTLQ